LSFQHLDPIDLSRARTVRAAAGLSSERGVAGTGLRGVIAAAGTPRGSLSHHFPGGKDELVIEAMMWSALNCTNGSTPSR
jgi:AcrR family transcriptional regulator